LVPSFGANDQLVPVPLHPERLRRRGYNQSALLAERVAMLTGIPVCSQLRRIRPTLPQVGLGAEDRARNVEGAFVADQAGLVGLRLILIDDVLTTGSTLTACAGALLAAGAASVGALTLGRGMPERERSPKGGTALA